MNTSNTNPAPINHAHWATPTIIEGKSYDFPHCSHCGNVPRGINDDTKFCADCGARMNGGEGTKETPTPTNHGHWIVPTRIGGRSFNIPHCSVCNGVPCGTTTSTKYCNICGAKMTLEV